MADNRARAELAAIHAGKKALGWDEETYRNVLLVETGKQSARDLSPAERAKLLDFMRTRGFQRTGRAAAWDGRTAPTQLEKARALWGELAGARKLKDPSEQSFNRFVHRVTGRSRVEWCTPEHLSQVIEALKAWLRREGVTNARAL